MAPVRPVIEWVKEAVDGVAALRSPQGLREGKAGLMPVARRGPPRVVYEKLFSPQRPRQTLRRRLTATSRTTIALEVFQPGLPRGRLACSSPEYIVGRSSSDRAIRSGQ